MALSDERKEFYAQELSRRYPGLAEVKGDFLKAFERMESCYQAGGKLLIAGNGGSAADAEHIAGELMKRFVRPRPLSGALRERLAGIDPERGEALGRQLEMPLTAIPLVGMEALSTAFLNDVNGLEVFAQQLLGLGRPGDVLLAITTSGNSENVLNAAVLAKALDISVIGLTGRDGGKLKALADIMIKAPEKETYKVQELHLPIYHALCIMLEESFFPG